MSRQSKSACVKELFACLLTAIYLLLYLLFGQSSEPNRFVSFWPLGGPNLREGPITPEPFSGPSMKATRREK
jgi:hypothetical protein